MYPPLQDHPRYSTEGHQIDHPRYSTEGHQIHVPVSGVPDPSPPQSFAASYISSSVRSHGVAVPGRWSSGLCHCCDDPANCMITSCCPCITFGQIAEIANRGSRNCATSGALYALLLLTGFPCLYSCFYRSKLRGQYDLHEEPCADCLVHVCCETCALCQEYRELKIRGYDMGIGWEANMDRQKRGVTIAPIVAPGMRR